MSQPQNAIYYKIDLYSLHFVLILIALLKIHYIHEAY